MTRRMTRVAFQGRPGAYGEEAALGWFGPDAETVPASSFAAVCAAVRDGDADAGVLPLENSLAGTVGDALDALAATELQVVGEVLLPVRHLLLGPPGASVGSIRRVLSHWQALAQCDRFLSAHGWERVPVGDTATAAAEVAERADPTRAAIASRRAAQRHGLAVLAENVADGPANVTRFAVVSARAGQAMTDGPRSTLLTFETVHQPGALVRALAVLGNAGINLSRIESRPSGEAAWHYRFLVQLDGDATREPLAGALESLTAHVRSMRVLGSFVSRSLEA
jgi:prephenate dehydratase